MNYKFLKSNAAIRITLWFRVIFLCFWLTMTIVDGFGKYDAVPPSSFNCISHVGFWALIELIVLAVGFSLCPSEYDITSKPDVTVESMAFWIYLIVLAIIANIIHIVASALELSECKSTLCIMNSGFLIAMIVVLGLLVCLEIFEIYIVNVFKNNIKEKNQ